MKGVAAAVATYPPSATEALFFFVIFFNFHLLLQEVRIMSGNIVMHPKFASNVIVYCCTLRNSLAKKKQMSVGFLTD